MSIDKQNIQQKKIRRRSNGGGSKLYFHKGTQLAIVSYQQAPNDIERANIYTTEIFPAFEKLVENLINIHKFTSIHDSYDDLKLDCMNFLFEQLRKFDSSRGTNAFSYFNVIAKNWLIIKTKQKNTRLKRLISLDDSESITSNDSKILDEYYIVPHQDFESLGLTQDLIQSLYEIRSNARNENELLCINSIISIFENIDNLDLLNKSAVLLYLRELSGLKPKQLTTALQSIKKHYKRIKYDALRGEET